MGRFTSVSVDGPPGSKGLLRWPPGLTDDEYAEHDRELEARLGVTSGPARAVDLDIDAFVRSAQRVAAAYSAALPALDLPVRVAHLGITVDDRHPRGPAATVELDLPATDGVNWCFAGIPVGVADLTPTARALLALDVICVAAERLGELAGWDPAFLTPARQHVLDAGLQFRATGPWKNSPDRRHKARLMFRIGDDAWGRARVEVSDGASVRVSPEFTVDGSGGRALKRDGIKLWWDSASVLSYGPFGWGTIDIRDEGTMAAFSADRRIDGDSLTPHDRGVLRDLGWGQVGLGDLAPGPGALETPVDQTAPRPEVVRYAPEPEPRDRMRSAGGGDAGFEPLEYTHALINTLKAVNAPEWTRWWSAAGQGLLEMSFWIGWGVAETSYKVRKVKDRYDPEGRHKFDAVIRRPYGSVPAKADHAAVARDDVAALVATVRARFSLGPHPEFPLVEIDHEWASTMRQSHRDMMAISPGMLPPEVPPDWDDPD